MRVKDKETFAFVFEWFSNTEVNQLGRPEVICFLELRIVVRAKISVRARVSVRVRVQVGVRIGEIRIRIRVSRPISSQDKTRPSQDKTRQGKTRQGRQDRTTTKQDKRPQDKTTITFSNLMSR